jgi:hypothetical protein
MLQIERSREIQTAAKRFFHVEQQSPCMFCPVRQLEDGYGRLQGDALTSTCIDDLALVSVLLWRLVGIAISTSSQAWSSPTTPIEVSITLKL